MKDNYSSIVEFLENKGLLTDLLIWSLKVRKVDFLRAFGKLILLLQIPKAVSSS